MKLLMYSSRYFLIALMGLLFFHGPVMSQDSPTEEDYFKIMDVPSPEHHLLEVGGLTVLPNGDLGIATRRGDIFIVENPTSNQPYFRKFATGLHEVLGLTYMDLSLIHI